jgi:hypothetical protein
MAPPPRGNGDADGRSVVFYEVEAEADALDVISVG